MGAKTMPADSHNVTLGGILALLLSSCAIPNADYALIPPPGLTREQQSLNVKECWSLPQSLSGTPLTEAEKQRIGHIETGRFSEGGRGQSLSSQRYLLCLLDNNYQLLEMPLSWTEKQPCETLSAYQSAGIERDRLVELCKNPRHEQCRICRAL